MGKQDDAALPAAPCSQRASKQNHQIQSHLILPGLLCSVCLWCTVSNAGRCSACKLCRQPPTMRQQLRLEPPSKAHSKAAEFDGLCTDVWHAGPRSQVQAVPGSPAAPKPASGEAWTAGRAADERLQRGVPAAGTALTALPGPGQLHLVVKPRVVARECLRSGDDWECFSLLRVARARPIDMILGCKRGLGAQGAAVAGCNLGFERNVRLLPYFSKDDSGSDQSRTQPVSVQARAGLLVRQTGLSCNVQEFLVAESTAAGMRTEYAFSSGPA